MPQRESVVPPSPNRVTILALPSEVNSLFGLLMLAALMSSVNAGCYVYTLVKFGDARSPLTRMQPKVAGSAGFSAAAAAKLRSDSIEAFVGIMSIAAFPAGVGVLGVVGYLNHPGKLRRRKRLTLLDPAKTPQIFAAISELSARAGIFPPPIIEISPEIRANTAQVFGVGSQLSIRLSSGLCLDHDKRGPSFEPIVTHELAHIANKDIVRTYLADALWRAFFIVTLATWLAIASITVIRGEWRSFGKVLGIVWIGLQFLATLAAVSAIRAAMLRGREYRADARASALGVGEALADAFRKHPPPLPRFDRIKRYWRLHPTAPQRLAALNDPAFLFRRLNRLQLAMGFLLALAGTGLFSLLLLWAHTIMNAAMGIAMPIMANLPDAAEMQPDQALPGYVGTSIFLAGIFLAIAPLIAGLLWIFLQLARTIALVIQRGIIAHLVFSDAIAIHYRRLWTDSILLAAGLEIGYATAPLASAGRESQNPVLIAFVYFPLAVVGFGLALSYLSFFSAAVLRTHVGNQYPHAKLRWITYTAGILLCSAPGCPLVLRSHELSDAGSFAESLGVFIVLGILLAIVAYLLSIAFSAILFCWRPGLRGIQCPRCLQHRQQKVAFGQYCEPCGAALAAWPQAALIPSLNSPLPLPGTGRKMGMTSLILGALAVLTSLLWPISLPLALVAIALGHVTRRRSARGRAGGKLAGSLGLLCAYASLATAALFLLCFYHFATHPS